MSLKTQSRRIYVILTIFLLVLGVFSENIQNNSPLTSVTVDHSHNISNYPSSFISAAGKTLPVEQFVSEKSSCAQEALAGIRQRTARPLFKSGRNYLIGIIASTALLLTAFGIWFVFYHEKREILSNIIIIDYIHLQDGQKP